MGLKQFKRWLCVASYAYLGLPYVIFFGGWMRPPVSLLAIALLAAGIVSANRRSRDADQHDENPPGMLLVRWSTLAAVLLPVVIVGTLAGAGGWGFQDSDWLKHNSILRDLIERPWPVIYEVDGNPVMLTYYIAYQLPAALVGKLFGWNAANHALFVYTLAGLIVSILWVWALAPARAWWFVVVFLAFSGLDVIGQLINALYLAPTLRDGAAELAQRLSTMEHLEWWGGWGFAQFSSTAALIVWVPNQATAGWLLTSLALHDSGAGRIHRTGVLLVSLCTLWAPFVALGLLPFVALLILQRLYEARFGVAAMRQLISWPNAVGVIVAFLIAFYLAGRFEPYPLPNSTTGIYQERITLTFLRLPELFVVRYALFIGLEFLILHVLLHWYLALRPDLASVRPLLILATAILLFLPILNWGWNNEPAMRSSIPALFVTILVTIRVLGASAFDARQAWIRTAIVAVLAVGSLNAAVEIGRHVAGTVGRGELVLVPPEADVKTLFQLQEERYRQYYNFVGQYLGSAHSRFATLLAKR